MSDEELATVLQQQYRLEFMNRQTEKQREMASAPPRRPTASAPPATSPEFEVVMGGEDSEAYARRLQRQMDREAASSSYAPASPRALYSAPSNRGVQNVGFGGQTDDSEDARLAQQLQDEELARSFSARNSNYNNATRSSSNRHLSQELADAEMAQRIAARDNDAALRRQNSQQTNSQPRWCRRMIPLTILAIAITIPLLFVFGVFRKEDVPFLDDFGNDWIDNDPWGGVGTINNPGSGGDLDVEVPSNAVRWATRNNQGLTLDILNAMEDSYDTILATAVENWDAGAPIDSLTLRMRKVEYDFECSDQNGVLKVCNGDYGATKWRGLNEVKLNSQTRIIVSSTARMNDYYLTRESVEQKLYTVCHELGHGFGLPHWDVDFYNQDMGNCMDYTIRPENNMRPSASNFEYLAVLYGGRNVTASTAQADTVEGTFEEPQDQPSRNDQGKNKDKGKNRARRLLHESSTDRIYSLEIPEENLTVIRHFRLA